MDTRLAAEKLREQNNKLKSELETLREALNEAIKKQKAKDAASLRVPKQSEDLQD
jgi:hypothetical protein